MDRSSFLKGLLATGGLSILPFKPAKRYQKIHLLQTFVAGFRYYKSNRVLQTLKAGDIIALKREPDNKHDDAAIALFQGDKKIGYVPSEHNFTLCRIIDGNLMELHAEVTHVKPEAADWEKVCVLIYTLKEETALPPYAAYLTTVYTPEYLSVKKKDWYEILVEKSRTDHVYDLIHLQLKPGDTIPNHDGDFVAINKRTLPDNKAVRKIINKIDEAISEIDHAFDDEGIIVLKTEQLTEFLEAGYELHPLKDKLGRKFLELKFEYS